MSQPSGEPHQPPRPWAPGRFHARRLARTVVLWGALAAIALAGWLGPADGLLFDAAVRLAPHGRPPQVALAYYADGRAGSVAGMPQRITALRDHGARDVLIVAPAAGPAQPGSPAPAVPTVDSAPACLPDATAGVVRRLRVRDEAGTPCLLGALARQATGRLPAAAAVYPDFTVRTATAVPRITLRDGTPPAALREAVGGRTVVLYPGPDPRSHVTPLYPTDGLLEPSVLLALGLDAVLGGHAVPAAPRGSDVLAAALVVLLLKLALRRARYRFSLVVMVLSTVPVLLGLGLLLRAGVVYVPAAATVLAIAGLALLTVLERNRALADTLVALDHRLTGMVEQPLSQGLERNTGLVWEQANRFASEFFDLRRSIMLELPAGATHMRPVASIGGGVDDLIEKRRDYRRAPYSNALARELPTAPSRPFLAHVDGLVDFIAPLVAADQLVGFWAFSVPGRSLADTGSLAPEAARYASEIAKVVLRANHVLDGPDPGARRWPSLARQRSRLIDGATQAREQLAAYRDVFSAVGHPIAVSDLLGRIQFANPAFEEFAAHVSQPLLAMSIGHMLEQLCGLAPGPAKEVMRRAVLGGSGGQPATLAVHVPELPGRYLLALRPIVRRAPAGAGGSPFDMLGMIVEIVGDARSAEAARQLGDAAGRHARRTWSLLDMVARTLEHGPVDAAAQERLRDLVARGLGEARHMVQLANEAAGDPAAAALRVDVHQLLRRIRQAAARPARDKQVTVHLAEQGDPTASVREDTLAAVLTQALALLVEDAVPGSAVQIGCSRPDPGTMRVTLSNEGYGLPESHVADVMRGAHAAVRRPDDGPLDRLAHAATALDANVAFELSSQLGSGYRVRLTLPGLPL